jgi:pimeloyl-ACP methyl ester carboxylesterase
VQRRPSDTARLRFEPSVPGDGQSRCRLFGTARLLGMDRRTGGAASPQTIALVQHTLRATNPAGFMRAARFLTGDDKPPLGAGLTMPLLLIQGEEDRVRPASENAELLATAVPGAMLLMLPGCGHLPEVESQGPTVFGVPGL